MSYRPAVSTGCALVALVAAGCANNVKSAADHYATVTAGMITSYLEDHVVRPGQPAATTRGQVFEGDNAARGAVCVRYTVGTTRRLTATTIDCPSSR